MPTVREPDKEYWRGRFFQLEAASHRNALETMGAVDEAYRSATRELDGEISRWYRRFADNNGIVSMAEARKLLNSGELDEFKWTVDDYIKAGRENGITADWSRELENASARWHISRYEALKVEMRGTVENLYQIQNGRLQTLMEKTYQETYGHTAYEIQKGVGVGWNVPGLNRRAIRTATSKPWGADGRNFSERIWSNKDALLDELHKQLTQNMLRGGTVNDAIGAIEKRMGVSHYQAERLVRTENAYIRSVATKESYKECEVRKVQFLATLDERTSEICRDMDGQIIDMKDYEPGVTVPPMHPLCRSTTVPYFDDMAGIGQRVARDPDTGENYYVDRGMTYREWEKSFLDDADG